jgi:hypothetical protein
MFSNKRNLTFLVALFCIAILVISALTWKTDTSSGVTSEEEFKEQIRNGLAEIDLPTSNNLSEINSASDNLANFISYRSGIQISQANKNLLKNTEQSFWAESKSVTPEQLNQILTDVVLERIPNLTNTNITNATESLRGFNASNLPTGFQQGRSNVRLRSNGEGIMSATLFQTEVTDIRDSGVNKFVQSAISSRIALEVERRITLLADASPETFGEAKSELTPMQAMLITYSIVTDDPLAYNQAGLQQKMQGIQQGISQAIGASYPSPQNYRAYGENGYIYSSPANLALDDSSITRILNLIIERGGEH